MVEGYTKGLATACQPEVNNVEENGIWTLRQVHSDFNSLINRIKEVRPNVLHIAWTTSRRQKPKRMVNGSGSSM
jgi:hypothetical protein